MADVRARRFVLFLMLAAALAASGAVRAPAATQRGYSLPASPLELVTSEDRFAPFARTVLADVERELASTPSPKDQRLKLLLGLQVHLALHFRDDALALRAAERIRALQTDPGDAALAGLTTRAIVAAHHSPSEFESHFRALLRTLPRDPAIRTALIRARERIATLSERGLLDDLRKNPTSRLARGEPCTLECADQLVRVRHRLTDILPLRASLLRVYDAAIAAQE